MKHDDPQQGRTARSLGPLGISLVVLLLFAIVIYLVSGLVGCLAKEDVHEFEERDARLSAPHR